uniref:GTx1-2 n=1 Tax=Grammostola rosea TaxID=432528 RepID=M5AWS0_GRARO|nr:GTx1-2 [Grammostola rosea]
MRTSVLAAILGLALFAVLCSGSELQEKDLKETLLSAIMETALEAEPEERECRYLFGGCETTADCCKHLGCKFRDKYCAWDFTFSK